MCKGATVAVQRSGLIMCVCSTRTRQVLRGVALVGCKRVDEKIIWMRERLLEIICDFWPQFVKLNGIELRHNELFVGFLKEFQLQYIHTLRSQRARGLYWKGEAVVSSGLRAW